MIPRRRITRHGWLTLALAAAAAAIALAAPTPSPACGCGVLIRANITGEKALVSFRHRVETIVPGLGITRVGPRAAVVFPVPGRPRVRALPSNVDIFGQLEAATAPKQTKSGSKPGAAGAAAPGPAVISRQQLGGYEVTVLKGGTGQTISAWLRSNKYTLPNGSQPILQHYIGRKWYFVAIRLADTRSGEIKPLAIAFRSRLIAYPMLLSRVATTPMNVELFVNTSGPASARGVDGFTTTFTGRVRSLSPAPSPSVMALLPEPYLTRLESNSLVPSSISKDVVLRVRRVSSPAKSSSSHPLRIAAIVAVVVVVLGVVGYEITRRRRKPPDDARPPDDAPVPPATPSQA